MVADKRMGCYFGFVTFRPLVECCHLGKASSLRSRLTVIRGNLGSLLQLASLENSELPFAWTTAPSVPFTSWQTKRQGLNFVRLCLDSIFEYDLCRENCYWRTLAIQNRLSAHNCTSWRNTKRWRYHYLTHLEVETRILATRTHGPNGIVFTVINISKQWKACYLKWLSSLKRTLDLWLLKQTWASSTRLWRQSQTKSRETLQKH